jgi:hypothetical protein
MFRCHDWRLTAQNRKVWGQKLREAVARIGPQRHGMDRKNRIVFGSAFMSVCRLTLVVLR